jgi:signal transduction histidine kinase
LTVLLATFSAPSETPSLPVTLSEHRDFAHVPETSVVGEEHYPDLVLMQDTTGRCLSFYCKYCAQLGLNPTEMVGQGFSAFFMPAIAAPYLARLQYVLEYSVPQQFRYPLHCGDRYLVFDLTISPVLASHSGLQTAVVSGQWVNEVQKAEALALIDQLSRISPPLSPEHRRKLLAYVSRDVRRSLDLDTIRQKTVDGLGELLALDRCLLCDYRPGDTALKVVSEFHTPNLDSMLASELELDEHSSLNAVLQARHPKVLSPEVAGLGDLTGTIIAAATYYKDQSNGLILMHVADPDRAWIGEDMPFLQELADHIGTDIAHATLFAESQSLTAELQRANARLQQKHLELQRANTSLEEAHQQAEEASRLKSEFLANTSHELRTPLNGMMGFLKLILDGMTDDPVEQQEFIQEAYNSAYHLLNIINDILDIAKIEAGKMDLARDPVNLDDLMQELYRLTRKQAEQKNLSLEISTPDIRDPVILLGDYQRLLQVLMNLVGNSLKFTHEGEIKISTEILPEKQLVRGEERRFAKISVADTGIGVSLEKQDKLFQNFSQIDSSRTRQYGGTGLGLAISQKLVAAMDGVVNFFSLGEGLGATVAFTVPLFQDPIMVANDSTDSSELLKPGN